jgi:hypothetical protein
LAGIGQIPDALRAERLRESLSLLAGIVKIGSKLFLYSVASLSMRERLTNYAIPAAKI